MFCPCSEVGIFMHWTCNSMNKLSSYCGLVDAKIGASDKDLPVLLLTQTKPWPSQTKLNMYYKKTLYKWCVLRINYVIFPQILVLLTRPIEIENTADISYDFTDAFEAGSSGTQNIFYAGFPIYQDQDTVGSCSQDVGITIPTIIWNKVLRWLMGNDIETCRREEILS